MAGTQQCVEYSDSGLVTHGRVRDSLSAVTDSVGCESMLKLVGVSVGVSVEGETRVGVGNHSLV